MSDQPLHERVEILRAGARRALRDVEDRLGALVDLLSEENTVLRKALIEALDIAQYEADEYQGKPENLVRIRELRKLVE